MSTSTSDMAARSTPAEVVADRERQGRCRALTTRISPDATHRYSARDSLTILSALRDCPPPQPSQMAREQGKRGSYSATYGPHSWQCAKARTGAWLLSAKPVR